MHIEGWILKVDTDQRRSRIILAFKDKSDGYREASVYYTPHAYIGGDKEEAIRILKGFQESILDIYTEKWRLPPWYDKGEDIYVAKFSSIEEYYRFLRFIRSEYRPEISLYNTVPTITQRFLMEIGTAPSLLTRVYLDGGRIYAEDIEDRDSIEYSPPPFKRIGIRLFNWYGEVYNPWREKKSKYLVSVDGDKHIIEINNIDTLIDYIHDLDPDIIEFSSSYIYKWLLSIRHMKRELFKRRRVYISYDSTVLEPHEYHGLIELSRLSYTDIGKVSKYSIGKILTTIEAVEAIRRGMAVPEYRVDIERVKTFQDIYIVDRGGLYYIPTPGIYWNVAQCDFTSLYPNIIVRYNISNETVNRGGCNKYIVTPIKVHKICMDIKGIVPIVLEKLIRRRVALKDLAKKTGDPSIHARQNAIKWILVACFGYLGYRNARFGKIEAYESVTAYARYILEKTIEIARRRGFRVVHAIVDSIWVLKKDATLEDYINLCMEISREIGIRMELETYYKWLYLPRNISRPPIAQINRYYGVGYDGEIKVKGIELVRRDTPPLIKRFQREAIEILSKANDTKELSKYTKYVLEKHAQYKAKLMRGDVHIKDLLITKRITRRWGEYRGRNLFIEAVKKYRLWKGEIVRFIVTSSGEAVPVEHWRRGMGYSRSYYIKRLNKSLNSLPIEYIDRNVANLEDFKTINT